jgi:cell division septum initiation protein DivIVA
MYRQEFIDLIKTEYDEFLNHVHRVKAQYSALRKLKENLQKQHLILQMNFAEHFSSVSMDEIQSAY